MGNSRAYPVFRTTDVSAAYRQAKRLCSLLERRDEKVQVKADLHTVGDVRRMAAVLPNAAFDYRHARRDPTTGDFLWCDLDVPAADDTTIEGELPLEITEDVPRGSVEDLFVSALGHGMAGLDWAGRWPDDPEVKCHGSAKYDGVHFPRR
jgi:hypothetical protein